MSTATGSGHRQTAAALAARRTSAQAALQRVDDAIARLKREKAPVTIAAVARRAGVSRTFLYDNPQARAAVAGATAQHGTRRAQDLTAQDAKQEASWRDRPASPPTFPSASAKASPASTTATSTSWLRRSTTPPGNASFWQARDPDPAALLINLSRYGLDCLGRC